MLEVTTTNTRTSPRINDPDRHGCKHTTTVPSPSTGPPTTVYSWFVEKLQRLGPEDMDRNRSIFVTVFSGKCNSYETVFFESIFDTLTSQVCPAFDQARWTPPREHAFPDVGRCFANTEFGVQTSDAISGKIGTTSVFTAEV
ncbi:unnamed protein product [Clavelina lepadiformis]|uniref:Uncharacterized protein n=1 Tax=Clavelina lepadiformis TaxID=159417 RepID=A0ABP0F4B4_CLALP